MKLDKLKFWILISSIEWVFKNQLVFLNNSYSSYSKSTQESLVHRLILWFFSMWFVRTRNQNKPGWILTKVFFSQEFKSQIPNFWIHNVIGIPVGNETKAQGIYGLDRYIQWDKSWFSQKPIQFWTVLKHIGSPNHRNTCKNWVRNTSNTLFTLYAIRMFCAGKIQSKIQILYTPY